MTSGRTLVAGLGNVFLGDDGFGVEVVRQLAARPLPPGVELLDVGIRGVHLAYELLDGCELLVLVDTAARGQPPGTVSVLRVDPADVAAGPELLDAHSLGPDAVLGLVRRLGGRAARTLVVACEPADLAAGMQLSASVRAAVPEAVRLIESMLSGDLFSDDEGARDVRQVGQVDDGRVGDRAGVEGDSGRSPVRQDRADVRD